MNLTERKSILIREVQAIKDEKVLDLLLEQILLMDDKLPLPAYTPENVTSIINMALEQEAKKQYVTHDKVKEMFNI